jgi:hypothetical protein
MRYSQESNYRLKFLPVKAMVLFGVCPPLIVLCIVLKKVDSCFYFEQNFGEHFNLSGNDEPEDKFCFKQLGLDAPTV